MSQPTLSAVQRTIVECVAALDEPLPRSTLAKLLVGSHSARAAALSQHPYFGRLADRTRKSIVYDVDILLQQQVLALDGFERVVMLPHAAAALAIAHNPPRDARDRILNDD